MDRIGMRLLMSLVGLAVLPGLCAELRVPADVTGNRPAMAGVELVLGGMVALWVVGVAVRVSRGARGATGRREAEARRERVAARLPEQDVPLHVPPPAPPRDPDPALPWEQP